MEQNRGGHSHLWALHQTQEKHGSSLALSNGSSCHLHSKYMSVLLTDSGNFCPHTENAQVSNLDMEDDGTSHLL